VAGTVAEPLDTERGPRAWAATLGLLSGPVLWMLVFFLVPIVIVAAYSVGVLSLFPTDVGFNLSDWKLLLVGDSVYMSLFWKSVRMSLTVSVVVVVLAYPVAYFLALVVGKRRYVLLLLIIAPFLTSYLLRVFAWKVILGDEGILNSFLVTAGLRGPDDPLHWLLYSQFTVILVLIYVWVPFVALPIFVVLESLDHSVLEAATDLGASRWGAFWRVTFPLSLRGIGAAFVFVFIPTIGEFVTPSLVGGPSGFMFGNAIAGQFTQGIDWQKGSVLSIFLLFAVLLLISMMGRFVQLRNVRVA